ncbi:MAG: GNAT family N-acetyltransferase [Clostridia bacterium]|nr:GNAT family N-acetyltransferase [Clostridia bacterium]
MLKKLSLFSKNRIKSFLAFADGDPVFGARMATLQKAHGFTPDTEFFVDEPLAGGVRGIVARFYGTVYLAAKEDADPLFAASYLKRSPFWIALEGRESLISPLAKELGITHLESSWCMLHDGKTFPGTEDYDIRKSENLPRFFEILSACHEGFRDNTNYRLWFGDYAARIGAGLTELYFLCVGGEAVSCATLNVQNGNAAVIGSVSTMPAFRGRGYGRAVSAFVQNRIRELGLRPALQCSEDSLAGFYAPLGYEKSFRWMIAER